VDWLGPSLQSSKSGNQTGKMILLPLSTLFIWAAHAQRPASTTPCDYYAQLRYGSNTNITQFRLTQDIVTMAFGGPFDITTNVSSDLTGIWNPGNFEGLNVYLRPWFDGTRETSNFNNAPVAINWLDGGLKPLQDYLDGKTLDVQLNATSNQAYVSLSFFGYHEQKMSLH
jgi:hypothetical protein